MKKLFIFLLILNFTYGYYYIVPGKRPKSAIDKLPFKQVADMRRVPQNPIFYAKQIKNMSKERQLTYEQSYNMQYFSPWYQKHTATRYKDIVWIIDFVKVKKLYDYHNRLITPSQYNYWIRNANFKALNSVKLKAISIRHTNFRALPTYTPAYKNSNKGTEGFPFDYFQNSELHMNVPLFISHYSLDRKWAYVEAGHVSGWVKVKDIAIVTPNFIRAFKSGKYRVTVKDNLWLLNSKKKRVTLLKLSTIFPVDKSGKWLLCARKSKSGHALLTRVKPPPKYLVAPKPVPFNSYYVAKIAKELYNEPYGWGGKMMTRDCSATTRDFFAPFGIFLQRNSSKQVKAGKVINIKGLKPEKKREIILKYAKPFASMLYVPGHITIYIGRYKNEPIIMHSYWGVRLKDWSKYPLSRTIITTTKPGDELPNIRKKSELINTLQKIILF